MKSSFDYAERAEAEIEWDGEIEDRQAEYRVQRGQVYAALAIAAALKEQLSVYRGE